MSHDQPDFGKSVYSTAETYQAAQQTHALVAEGYPTHQTNSTKSTSSHGSTDSPALPVSEQNSVTAFVKGFGQAAAHTLIQSPLEGSAQLIDHTVGKLFDSHLYEKSKDLIISAPEQTTFGTAEWHGQTIGGAVGMAPLFLVTRTSLRTVACLSEITGRMVASDAEVLASKGLFSAVGGKMVLEGGATGAAYSGLFKSVDAPGTGGSGNYWRSKAASMASDFATFATLTAGSVVVGNQLKSAVQGFDQTFPNRAVLAKNIAGVAGAALGSLPAAAVDTIGQYAQTGDNTKLSLHQFEQNAYTYALLGAGLAPLHSKSEQASQSALDASSHTGHFIDQDLIIQAKVAERPDLQTWLRDNPKISDNLKNHLILTWDEFPDSYKKMDGQVLQQVLRVWNRMDAADWAKVSAEDASVFAKTIQDQNLYLKDTQYLAHNQEVAHWFVANEAKFDYGDPALIAAAHVWHTLTPEQKNLPVDQLKATAQIIDSHATLTRIYGTDTSVVDHLRALEKPNQTSPLVDVSNWLVHVFETQKSHDYARAASVVQELVDLGAEREKFTPTYLSNYLTAQTLFHDNPAMQAKLEKIFPDDETRRQVFDFIMKKPNTHGPLMEAAIDLGFTGAEHHWVDFHAINNLQNALTESSGDAPTAPLKLFQLISQRVDIDQLTKYLTQTPGKIPAVKLLIEQDAGRRALSVKSMQELDHLPLLAGLNPSEEAQVRALHDQGLSIMRLYNHLLVHSDGPQVMQLIRQGADARTLDNYLKLSTYPKDVTLKLVEAVDTRKIKAEDVLAKTRDWHAGRHFRDLLINHVTNEGTLSAEELQGLHERAQKIALNDSHSFRPSLKLRAQKELIHNVPEAATFVATLRGIERKIPADKPIVLLGRDAWPLLPLLRLQGRDVQYFLWSRLQMEDQATKKQWLKEVPPNAAIIDTGYSGSIIKAIRAIDPGVSGYLMSAAFGARFPRLLRSSDHRDAVDRIEKYPKLIYRTSAHTENGGAVSRKNQNHDLDSKFAFHESSRWFAERRARELLVATGLPSWDTWRYSTFVGLTPMERLGLTSKTELEGHYQKIAAMRAAQAQR